MTDNSYDVSPNDPEVKKIQSFAVIHETSQAFDITRFDRFSTWEGLRKAVAVCRRYFKVLKGDANHRITVNDLANAEHVIIRMVQENAFEKELTALKPLGQPDTDRRSIVERHVRVQKTSTLHRLDPYVDENGTLRVGGRLRRSVLSSGEKHPVILPKKGHVTELVIANFHQKISHQGRGYTLNEIRSSGFWIVHGCAAVSSYISRCFTCRKLRQAPAEQKMADLPEDRVTEAPPFTMCAVDYFGPWTIKEGRREVKRYGVVFTCMASRAVHIETAVSLDTSSFINALRRFLALRGPIRELRSDRGTNFVGAQRELTEALSEMDDQVVCEFLLKNGCDTFTFNMNPPSASHRGGVWERQIRSIRSVLSALMLQSGTQLDDECLRTLMCEVTAVINSRPLTTDNLNDCTASPLSPSMILTMKSKILLPPPGNFVREDVYLRRRWRRVQHIANEFWMRWRKEFLSQLQVRQKWLHPRRDFKIGDIVLVKDENLPRCEWHLARVHKTYPSDDGHVRRVQIAVGNKNLDKKGRRLQPSSFLERPIQKLVLLLPDTLE